MARRGEQPPADRKPVQSHRGYGVLLMLGLFSGFGIGLMLGEPSAGTVIGLGAGALVAIGLRLKG